MAAISPLPADALYRRYRVSLAPCIARKRLIVRPPPAAPVWWESPVGKEVRLEWEEFAGKRELRGRFSGSRIPAAGADVVHNPRLGQLRPGHKKPFPAKPAMPRHPPAPPHQPVENAARPGWRVVLAETPGTPQLPRLDFYGSMNFQTRSLTKFTCFVR